MESKPRLLRVLDVEGWAKWRLVRTAQHSRTWVLVVGSELEDFETC